MSRLYETPCQFSFQVEQLVYAEEEEKIFAYGARQRRDVTYNDPLTERQWLRAVEEGNLGAMEMKVKQRKRRRVIEDEDDDDDDGEEDEEEESARKRSDTGADFCLKLLCSFA